MRRRPRTIADASIVTLPQRAEIYLSPEELAVACGVSLVRLYRLVRVGLVAPEQAGSRRFSVAAAARLRKMLRLRADLGVNLAGAEIIVDLLARVDRLEADLARARFRNRADKEVP